MKTIASAVLPLVLVALLAGPLPAQGGNDVAELIDDARLTVQDMTEQPDAGLVRNLLTKGHGVLIFPSVIRGGIGIGGQFGDGILLRRNPETGDWFGPRFVRMTGLSYGWQLGIQNISLIMVATNEKGIDKLQEGTVTLGGDVSIAAGPIGRRAQLGTDLGLEASIYSYSMTRGLFAGATIDGSKVEPHEDLMLAYWPEEVDLEEALELPADDARIQPLLDALNKIILVANENEDDDSN